MTIQDTALKLYELTPEQQVFVLAVHEGKTLTDSYIVCKPDSSVTTAGTMGSRWYNRVSIREAIDELQRQRTHNSFRLLRSSQPPAIKTLQRVAAGELDVSQERMRACLEILDRTGVTSKHIIGLEPSNAPQDGFDGFLSNVSKPSP